MDNERNICKYKAIKLEELDCYSENLGNKTHPIYSCTSTYYSNHVLITYENGIKDSVNYYDDDLIRTCFEANGTSYYLEPFYNCTSCKYNYTAVYSAYYQRIICVSNITEATKIRNNTISRNYDSRIPINDDGTCDDNFFTYDGRYCYYCNDSYIGIPGCRGKCNFSINRKNMVLCESGCKDGYIETTKGICTACDNLNWKYRDSYCKKCHYEENNYPVNYVGIKRARRFQCDECKEGYGLDKEGHCINCTYKSNKILIGNKCIYCDDITLGGIANCSFCKKNEKENGILCKECNEEYILLINNNTCLKRENNVQLEKFNSCLELKIESGIFICTRCKPTFSLLKSENNISKCTYIPILYDPNYEEYYSHYYKEIFGGYFNDFQNYYRNDLNHRRSYFFPCKESINIGSKEDPIYTCLKCYNIFENFDYDYDYFINTKYFNNIFGISSYIYYVDWEIRGLYYIGYYKFFPVKIIDLTQNNISYCVLMNKTTDNCLEATYTIINGKEVYNCIKCRSNYNLKTNRTLNIKYCTESECLVDNCKICVKNNSHFCSICNNNYYYYYYEINNFTGSCVLKTKTIPEVVWKDIYNFNLDGQKEINDKNIVGPFLKLRGFTSSQINERHAFLINLIFKVKSYFSPLYKEIINIPAICEIENRVEKLFEGIQDVDYECIGNISINENYILTKIEEGENGGIIKNYNFNELNEIINNILINEMNLIQEYSPHITSDNIPIFIFYNFENITSNNEHIFNFILYGRIINDKNDYFTETGLYTVQIKLYNIFDQPNCTFYLEENKNGRLNIFLELKNDTKIDNISFENPLITIGNYPVYALELNKIYLFNIIDNEQNNNNHKNNKLKIALGVSFGFIAICLIIIILVCCIKSRNNNNTNHNDNIIPDENYIENQRKKKFIEIIKHYIYNKYKYQNLQEITLENIINEINRKFKEKIDKEKIKEISLIYIKDILVENLTCPITQEIFINPYIVPEGQTFDRNGINKCIEKDGKNPLTKSPLEKNQLILNKKVLDLLELYHNYKDDFNMNVCNILKNILSNEKGNYYHYPIVIDSGEKIGETVDGNNDNNKYKNIIIKSLIEQFGELLKEDYQIFDTIHIQDKEDNVIINKIDINANNNIQNTEDTRII